MDRVLGDSWSVGVYGRLAGRLPRPLVSRIYSTPWATRAVRRALGAVMPPGLHEAQVVAGPLAGARLTIYPRHEVSFVSGLWEYWVQDVVLQRLRPGDVAWDVGAYIGYFSVLMARQGASVLALEPDPSNRERLEWTLVTNHVANVQVLQVAAAGQDGTVYMERQGDSPAAAAAGESSQGTPVPARTLDGLCSQYGPPHLVKLDVEGAEAGVLEGAPRLVRDVQPIWLLELHGEAGERAVDMLRGAGYLIQHLNRAESATHQRHVLAVPSSGT